MIENYDDKVIQNFEYETTAISDGNIAGTCELGNATIQMINDSNEYSSLKGQWIKTIHGSFYIHDVEPVQEKVNIKLSCYDIKYKLDTPYDSNLYTWPMTLKEWRNAIFSNCGVEYDNSDFPNSDLSLNSEPYVGDNPSNRNVISQIAQAGCSFVYTDKDDIFYFKWFESTSHTINDWIELTTEKDLSNSINVVILGRGDVEDNVKWPETLPTNPIEFRIDNNYILDPQVSGDDIRYTTIKPIYDRVKGFSYLLFNMRTQSVENKLSIKLGQKVSYKDIWGNDLTAYVMSKKITYLGGDPTDDDNYEITLSSEEINETSTEYSYSASIENRLLKVERTANKQEGTIIDLIEQTSETSKETTKLGLAINELNGEVNVLKDVTSTINNNNYLEITDAVKGNSIYFSIKGDLSLLLPSSKTFLGSNTFFKSSKLIIEDNDGNKREIETNIRKLNALNNVYDEFITDDTGSYIIRRIGVNNDLTLYTLKDETKENLSLVNIELNEGYNKIYMKSFPNLNYTMKYAKKNEYTDIFTTKVEMNSAIVMNEENIDLKLEKKTDKDNIIAQINMSTEKNEDGSLIQIDSDKLNIKNKKFNLKSDQIEITSPNFSVSKEGEIFSKSGTIGGFKIQDYKLYGIHKKNVISYTVQDLEKIRKYILGETTLTDEEKTFYDYNKDGKVSSVDYMLIKNLIDNSNEEYTIEINSNYIDKLLNIQNEQGNILVKIGTNGSVLNSLYVTEKFDFDNRDNGGFEIRTATYDNANFFEITFPDDKTGQFDIRSDGSNGIEQVISLNSNGNVSCSSLTQTSLENNKKNLEKFTNALEEVKKTDIYRYNLKSEKDERKKHLGFIIGDNYNYSHEITSLNDDGKEIGVDNYSMTSLCLQAIKEQQIIIEKLESKIKELEEKISGNNN
ncbi:MAG: dockerin type I domain-containing protein [Bacilli bacterium]